MSMVDDDLDIRATDALRAIETAIADNRFDEAAQRLADIAYPGEEEAALYGKLADALIREERLADALPYAARCWNLNRRSVDRLLIFGWLLQQAGRVREAVMVFERAVDQAPHRLDGLRNLIFAQMLIGDVDGAAETITRAIELAPDNRDFYQLRAQVLEKKGEFAAAGRVMRGLLASDVANIHGWLHLATVCDKAGDADGAIEAMVDGARHNPNSTQVRRHASGLLMKAGRPREAIRFTREASLIAPDDASIACELSAILTGLGLYVEALDHAERAVALDPAVARYKTHLGSLYTIFERPRDAAAQFAQAAELDRTDAVSRKLLIETLLQLGEGDTALERAREALALDPGDETLRERIELIERQKTNRRAFVTTFDEASLARPANSDEVGALARPVRGVRSRRGDVSWTTYVHALNAQARIIWALILRETKTRYGKSRLGFGWALIEPVTHLAILGLVFTAMMHGRPPLGEHFFLFYFTGVAPYMIFTHTTAQLTVAIEANRALLQLPSVSIMDILLSRALLELATESTVSVLLICGFLVLGIPAIPADPLDAATAMFVLWLFAAGLGILNCMIIVRFKFWEKVWSWSTRILYFVSGIFYMPQMMPGHIRDVLVWNPILQGVEWFRSAFYKAYQPNWLDKNYLLMSTLLVFFLAFALMRVLRREATAPEQ